MGRPPCCDKVGIKKGPWTPEEDIILVSYIQEHGPGNWRSVPTNTGLLRCSKSCRLRWTNYLRPGIKRGNFTPHEEGMIIHLQALLGNKWAAIASYLPQRTDNDIKNYWNTHLKKKLKRFQSSLDPTMASDSGTSRFAGASSKDISASHSSSSKLNNPSCSGSSYASSTENISRLLEGWMRSSPANYNNYAKTQHSSVQYCHRPKHDQHEGSGSMIPSEEFDSIMSFGDTNNVNVAWDKSCSCESAVDLNGSNNQNAAARDDDENMNANFSVGVEKKQQRSENDPPFSILEKWLLDETLTGGQVEEIMELSPIF